MTTMKFKYEDEYHHDITEYDDKINLLRYNNQENNAQFWLDGAEKTLKEKIEKKEQKGIAKNVILFLGDGMSMTTLAASRIFFGQQSKNPGEETVLSFEKFPYSGLSKTYCVNSQVADSACSSTAYLNGVKGNIKTIGVTAEVKLRDCDSMNVPEHQTSPVTSWAQAEGKATGIVTTARVTHASPAGAYAHTAHRDWESDSDVSSDKQDPEKCMDIARQLVTQSPGNKFKVILGGGRGTFMTVNDTDPEYSNKTGWRNDNRNLINQWLDDKKKSGLSASYVWNREDMLKVNNTDCILGLFEPSHMRYHMEADPQMEPTLEEMTELAIKILSKEDKGYFLFVEGGKIDMAHHGSLAKMAFDETIEFAKAIQKANEMTSEKDTLIVVTADHAHTMSFSGYPQRGSDILTNLQQSGIDLLPYSTISYANGPGYKVNTTDPSKRYDLRYDNMSETRYQFPSTLPLSSETHGGEDVAVFSRGPWAHFLTGSFEQNYIPIVMGYAARIGPTGRIDFPSNSGSSIAKNHSITIIISSLLIILFTKIIKIHN
ncbi:membrane-bound alkaline phosphatase-like isoform X2 [Lycorma delicatula]|uniref:membrane-bound alkaline phosphatase-like isoform X2 n=1 Tax=Lycorma delicatula TaxID=130591 RepID=UPI003F5144A2